MCYKSATDALIDELQLTISFNYDIIIITLAGVKDFTFFGRQILIFSAWEINLAMIAFFQLRSLPKHTFCFQA
jgi:hypothetical protein